MSGFGFIEYKDSLDAMDVVPGMIPLHPSTRQFRPKTNNSIDSVPYATIPIIAFLSRSLYLTFKQMDPTSWVSA